MKRFTVTALALAATAFVPAFAGTSVGVSIGINEPGFYGRVNIGDVPPPVVYAQPVVIAPSPVAVYQRPIYLHVPPGYQDHWDRYCAGYGACGQPVYFVRDDWARDHYRRDGDHWRGGDRREDRHEDRREDWRGDRHDHGKGHGNGNGDERRQHHGEGHGDGHDDR